LFYPPFASLYKTHATGALGVVAVVKVHFHLMPNYIKWNHVFVHVHGTKSTCLPFAIDALFNFYRICVQVGAGIAQPRPCCWAVKWAEITR
jgi:hypothetical protein